MNKAKNKSAGKAKGGAMVGRCAGFSSAFVLRHSGVQICGEEAFKKVPFQMKGGLAFPKGITGFFKKRGIKMTPAAETFLPCRMSLKRADR